MDDDSSLASQEHHAFLPIDGEQGATAASPVSSHDVDGLPDRAALIAEIGRLTQLVGFLRVENERLAAERHDFCLRLEMQPGQGRRRPDNTKT